jgi:chromosomal replication initiation ATPase DnaA
MVAPELNEPPTVFINSNNMNLFWLKAKDKLRATLTPTQFETWLEPTIAIKLHERVVTIGCANDHARAWLTQRITTHAQNLLDHYVVFQVSEKVFEYDEDRDE